ncbi:glycosyltransferase family 2 protein [Reichenbachiella sp.]|uniref:glycosyltransferase family 2 protein n=1 Tax=Reichenbachiella sp. TaxID=2184521 RepID=UPI003BAE9764
MKKVSVVIPTHNRPDLLKTAVDSVLKQGMKELEVIIIDDYSEEKYLSGLERLARGDDQINVVRNNKNLGAAASRNKGLELATGEFVLFLDDDDILLPGMLSKSLDALSESRLDLVSCRSVVVGDDLTNSKLKRYNRQQTNLLNTYPMYSQPVEHIFLYTPQIHTFLIRREVIQEIRFPTDLKYGEDLMFWLTLVDKDIRCKKLDFVGCEYRIQKTSLSHMAGYKSKMSFYKNLLIRMEGNKVIQNLCCIKMAYICLSTRNLNFFGWGFKALSNPHLLFKHIKALC